MAPLLEDPRIRQTWNQFSSNAESATETAAAGIWTFQHTYINPCLSSISSSLEECTADCFPDKRVREGRRTRGRAELSFDFYDDWDEDEAGGNGGGFGSWGNDELDRLLAGSGSQSFGGDGREQPRRKRGMSYGTNKGRQNRKSLDPDPTIIPSTNTLGFLGRLPFKLGGTLRYKPSAADLQEHPGQLRRDEEEAEPLIDGSDEDEEDGKTAKGHRRQRSSTTSSGETSGSFRSRGDLFPSDGEDDAVPLPDEFAMVLERRGTTTNMDDKSSSKTRSSKGKRPAALRSSSKTLSRTAQSSQSTITMAGVRSSSDASNSPGMLSPGIVSVPSLADLQHEEERIRLEEEGEIESKRQAAADLARERGLHLGDSTDVMAESKAPVVEFMQQPTVIEADHEPTQTANPGTENERPSSSRCQDDESVKEARGSDFVPARLPNFG